MRKRDRMVSAGIVLVMATDLLNPYTPWGVLPTGPMHGIRLPLLILAGVVSLALFSWALLLVRRRMAVAAMVALGVEFTLAIVVDLLLVSRDGSYRFSVGFGGDFLPAHLLFLTMRVWVLIGIAASSLQDPRQE